MARPVPLLLITLAASILAAPPATSATSASGASARPAPRVAGEETTRRALLDLENAWAVAMVQRDSVTFRRVLAEGFVYTENDQVFEREPLLHELTYGADQVETARNEDMSVHVFGNTAAVTGWLIVNGKGPAGPFERRYRFTDTWTRIGNAWRIVAAQDYLLPTSTSQGR